MAAPSAPTAPTFSPAERPRAAIATDGTLAAIVESRRVVVLELPGGEPFAEVGVDPAALANEVAWVGALPRLLVLSRYADHSRVHLVDPHGPRALADLRLDAPMRLAATSGAHALAVAPQSAVIVTAADDLLVSVPYPSRTVPAHAGAAGTNFLVAHADSVEEWDPQARMPKRRLKLPRTATITTLGGSDRVVWMTTQQEPARLDVLALVDRGQPKAHDLPEPIVYATGHPRNDLVVCIGESGKVYVVDLDGRSKLRTLAFDGIDKVQAAGLVVGRIVGVLAAAADRPVAIVTLEGTLDPDVVRAPATSSTGGATGPTPAPAAASATGSHAAATTGPAGAGPSASAGSTSGPVERKKPPPPPPGRSGTTVPPPIASAAHATGGPVVPLGASGPIASLPASPPAASSSGGPASPPASVSPAASSLARPATRAFARAPTPHPRAPSEGVEVDLEGVFDELSAEGDASARPVEQFDAPLAFEARPVSDHAAHTTPSEGTTKPSDAAKSGDGAKRDAAKPADVAKPREAATKAADDASKPSAAASKPSATASKPSAAASKPSAAANKPSAAASKPSTATLGEVVATPVPPGEVAAKPAAASSDPGTPVAATPVATKPPADIVAAKPAAAVAEPRPEVPAPDDARAIPDDDGDDGEGDDGDDEDLAPPTLVRDESPTLVRSEARPRDDARVEVRAPVRDSGPLRAPARKVRREVTLRQGPALPASKPAWRDEIVYWTYEVFDGVVQRGAPIASPLDELAQRFDVPEVVLPALVVLYGAHLAGERGVAPVHVARVLGSWDEALGRGLLGARGLATFADSRVRIAGPIQRFLDEAAVETGALVGVPGQTLPGPHAVIAPAETPLKVLAVRWLAQVGGAILAAHDDADLAELFVEARARGATPMFRIGADELLELGTDPAILVVTDEDTAESLGVPRLG